MTSNLWARQYPNPELTIRCSQRNPAKPRVVGVVVAHPGRGLWLHSGRGIGAPLSESGSLPLLRCSCGFKSHPLDSGELLRAVQAGVRAVRVEGQRHLSHVD